LNRSNFGREFGIGFIISQHTSSFWWVGPMELERTKLLGQN
jgi:hypothetical protein